jgi:prophage antirepressor-like protein
MSKELTVLRFHNTEIEIVDKDGEKWVTVKAVAEGLGYSEQRALVNLINRNPQEFQGKSCVIKLMTHENHRSGARAVQRDVVVLSYHGVIRAAMLSDAPRAVEFRDWAENVLFQAMTKGYYLDQRLTDRLPDLIQPMIETAVRRAVAEAIPARLVPPEPDISHWPTPTQRLRELARAGRWLVPPRFNQSGGFDTYFASQHDLKYGHFPRLRERRYLRKEPEFVVEVCPESDAFLREMYRKYLRYEWPRKQRRLRLVMPKPRVVRLPRPSV